MGNPNIERVGSRTSCFTIGGFRSNLNRSRLAIASEEPLGEVEDIEYIECALKLAAQNGIPIEKLGQRMVHKSSNLVGTPKVSRSSRPVKRKKHTFLYWSNDIPQTSYSQEYSHRRTKSQEFPNWLVCILSVVNHRNN